MIKNQVSYGMLLGLAIYLSIMYHEFITTSFAIILILYPVLLFFCILVMKRGFHIQLSTDCLVAEKQQPFHIMLLLENHSIFPILKLCVELKYRSGSCVKWKKEFYYISLNERSTQQVSCGVTSQYCGRMEFELKRVFLSDPLGIFRLCYRTKQSMKVSVLPKFYEIPQICLSQSNNIYLEEEEYSKIKAGDDPSELFKIREYQQGDRINRIHWKLTAKEGNLMIKEFGRPLDYSVVLLLEPGSWKVNTEQTVDAVIETMGSISMKMIQIHRFHFLVWHDRTGQLNRYKIDSEESLYDALAQMFENSFSEEDLLTAYEAEYRIEQYSNLFYITGRKTLPQVGQVQDFAKRAKTWILQIISDEELTEEEQRDYLEQGIEYIGIHTENLEEIGQIFDEKEF